MKNKILYEVFTMANSKITERDIYNAMIDGTIDAETMAEFAEKKLAQLDKRNESAKKRAAKKRAESDELTEKIFEAEAHNAELKIELIGRRIEYLSQLEPDRQVAESITSATQQQQNMKLVLFSLQQRRQIWDM